LSVVLYLFMVKDKTLIIQWESPLWIAGIAGIALTAGAKSQNAPGVARCSRVTTSSMTTA